MNETLSPVRQAENPFLVSVRSGRQHVTERLIITQRKKKRNWEGIGRPAYIHAGKNSPGATLLSSRTKQFISAHLLKEIGELVNYWGNFYLQK